MPYAREVAIPYSGQTFSIVNTFIANTTIESSAANQNFSDIASNGLSVVVKLNGDSTMTGVLKLANGTVSAPSMTFGSDTNLGFYRVGADVLAVTVGGVLSAYWNSTGQVLYSADAGAAAGPVQTLYRDSASPAASDVIGQIAFDGEDDAGNQQQYAAVQATILDPASTLEDGKLSVLTTVAGTAAERAYVGQGVVVGAATGGDKGAGTVNATAYYDDNVQLFPAFPLPGAIGLVIQNNSGTPNTILDVDASVVVSADSSNNTFVATAVDLSINAGTTGANGLDAGALGANTWYYAYVIHNGTAAAGLLSTSATSPTLPSGYTYKVRLGAIKTGGSSTFLRVLQKGNNAKYVVVTASTTPNVPIMATSPAGDYAVPTWSAVATSAYVPTTATTIYGFFGSANVNGTRRSICAPNNSYGAIDSTSNPPLIHFNGGNVGGTVPYIFVLESTNIYWAAESTNQFIVCQGWVDNVNAS